MANDGDGQRADAEAARLRNLEDRLAHIQSSLASVTAQNERLVRTLKDARDQIVTLKAEVDRLAQPPSGYGTVLEAYDDGTVDVLTAGRKMRVAISPSIGDDALAPRPGGHAQRGDERRRRTRLRARGRDRDPQGAARLRPRTRRRSRRRGAGRPPGRVPQRHPVRAGDALLLDPRASFVYERIPKAEVEDLVLEEVPDIDYADIGGLAGQIEQIRDAIELPYLHPDLFKEHQLRPPKGVLLYGPPGCGKTLIAKAVAALAGRQGGRDDRPAAGQVLLPQHQGPGAAQQVRRRDRAAHPADLPAGPREGQRRHTGRRLLRRDGVALPDPRLGRELRRRDHDRAPAAQRDRRRRAAGERHRHRCVQPRGHDRPGHPAARPAGREDQDRAARRGERARHLQQVPHGRPAAAPERRRGSRRLAGPHGRRDDPRRRRADVLRDRREPVPRGHLRQRRQGDARTSRTSTRAR